MPDNVHQVETAIPRFGLIKLGGTPRRAQSAQSRLWTPTIGERNAEFRRVNQTGQGLIGFQDSLQHFYPLVRVRSGSSLFLQECGQNRPFLRFDQPDILMLASVAN